MHAIGSNSNRGKVIADTRFHSLTGLACALLDSTQQLILLTFDIDEIIVRELGPLLFEMAFENVPVALEFEFVHDSHSLVFMSSKQWGDHPIV